MSADALGQGDWTATVEQAVAVEIVRRRRWLRAYLALVLLITLATLALVWLQRETPDGQVERRLQPMAATTQRLSSQQVALARHQMDLSERLTRLETEAAALTAELRAPPPPAALPAPAGAPATAGLARRQQRLEDQVATLQQRVQRLEAPAPTPLHEAERARADAQADAVTASRLDRIEAALRALEASVAAAPAPGPARDPTARRLDTLDRRLGRLERTAVRAGAASAD